MGCIFKCLIKGAQDVYDRLSDEDTASYEKLKEAMTKCGFHKKFCYSRPENKKTFIQFSS